VTASPVVLEAVRPINRVEAAYRSIHPVLWRALLAYTADREMASDAEAEAFAQALRRGDEITDVAAWVWRSSFAIAAGMLQSRARTAPLAVTFDGVAEPSESAAEFVSLLGGLSGQQRACVVLRYVGGMDAAAIAAALNTSATTVRVQLHRAHGSLRRTLKEADHG
jgi:RNA polymerase sigma-70 factor, ECF subfamily